MLEDQPMRRLYEGFSVPALSLGGALLGGLPGHEVAAILRLAAKAGMRLVDTSSAYGKSEAVIGAAAVEMSVATKFGNPCGLNGHTHDYSPSHCAQALYNSLAQLQGKKIACLQLHSPPEAPSPLTPALVDLLNTLRGAGKFGSWGASVHTVNGGAIALSAGAQMLQMPYNLLQQENAALLAMCAVRGVGVLVQSCLCQGWLTDAGLTAARLLLSVPHRVTSTILVHGASVDLLAMLQRVLALGEIARSHGLSLSSMAMRFALHTVGVSSLLVQVRTASQLHALLSSSLSPLPAECHNHLVRLAACVAADGRLVHGAGAHMWHWGVPTPRTAIDAVVRRGYTGGALRLLTAALGEPHAATRYSRRMHLVEHGYVRLPGAFPAALAAELARDAFRQLTVTAGMSYLAYETSCYFSTDASARMGGEARDAARGLEAALEEILDACLYGEEDVHPEGVLGSLSLRGPTDHADLFHHNVVGHRSTATPAPGPWSPPDDLRPQTCEPIGCTNGWHIDNGSTHEPDFSLESYLASPWLVVVVLLTDVDDESGPTVLCPGSHHVMARMLSVCPARLSTNAIYSFCAATHTWASRFGRSETLRATGAAGDVYLLHPLLVHSGSMSCTGRARAILNLPCPYGQAQLGRKQGSLCGVCLPIRQAAALRHRTPRPLLWLLWALAIGAGWLHRKARGRRGDGCEHVWRARLLYLPSCAMAIVSAVCVLMLDAATAASVHDDRTPVLPDGKTACALREWVDWCVRLAQAPQLAMPLVPATLARTAAQAWHAVVLGLRGRPHTCAHPSSHQPVEELRPLVSAE